MSLANPKTVYGHIKRFKAQVVIVVLLVVCCALPAPTTTLLARPMDSPRGAAEYVIPKSVDVIDGKGNYKHVKPGSRLLIPAGTRGPLRILNLRGAPGAPIVIANKGGQVKIRTGEWLALDIYNCQHVRLTGTGTPGIEYGFDISGFTNSGVYAREGTEYIEIDHLEIHHSGDKGAGIRMNSFVATLGKNWVLNDAYIHHNYLHDIGLEAMYIGKASWQGGTPIHGLEIAYNRAERIGWDAYQVRYATKGCHVHHNYAKDVGQNTGGTTQGGAGLIIGENTGGWWHDNVVINADRGIQLLEHQGDVEVSYNLLIHCGYTRGEGGIIWFTKNEASIHHNTIVDSNDYGIHVSKATRGEVRDNIVAQTRGTDIRSLQVPTRYNLTAGTVADVRFVAPEREDYRLRGNSPGRRAASDGGDVGAFPNERARTVWLPMVAHRASLSEGR
jgi:hypothetical protein